MAMLGKTICYINSSCIALMRRVKTLEQKMKKQNKTKKDQERLLYYPSFTQINLLSLCSKMILSCEGTDLECWLLNQKEN